MYVGGIVPSWGWVTRYALPTPPGSVRIDPRVVERLLVKCLSACHPCIPRMQWNAEASEFYNALTRENLNASLITRLGTWLTDACMVLGGFTERFEWVVLRVHVRNVDYYRYESVNTYELNICRPIPWEGDIGLPGATHVWTCHMARIVAGLTYWFCINATSMSMIPASWICEEVAASRSCEEGRAWHRAVG